MTTCLDVQISGRALYWQEGAAQGMPWRMLPMSRINAIWFMTMVPRGVEF